jgi:hypothetical protein
MKLPKFDQIIQSLSSMATISFEDYAKEKLKQLKLFQESTPKTFFALPEIGTRILHSKAKKAVLKIAVGVHVQQLAKSPKEIQVLLANLYTAVEPESGIFLLASKDAPFILHCLEILFCILSIVMSTKATSRWKKF